MAFTLYCSGNGTAAGSLGGAPTNVLAPAALFGGLTDQQFQAGTTIHRLLYAQTDTTEDAVKAWIPTETPSALTTISIAWAVAAANATEAAIASETAVPPSVTFSAPTTFETGLAGGNLLAGQRRGIWLRCVITATMTKPPAETFTLSIRGTAQTAWTWNGDPWTWGGNPFNW